MLLLYDNVDFHTRENKSDEKLFEIELMHSCCSRKKVESHSDDWVFNTDYNRRSVRSGKDGDNHFNMIGALSFKRSDAQMLGKMIKDVYRKTGYERLFWDDVVNVNLDKLKC